MTTRTQLCLAVLAALLLATILVHPAIEFPHGTVPARRVTVVAAFWLVIVMSAANPKGLLIRCSCAAACRLLPQLTSSGGQLSANLPLLC